MAKHVAIAGALCLLALAGIGAGKQDVEDAAREDDEGAVLEWYANGEFQGAITLYEDGGWANLEGQKRSCLRWRLEETGLRLRTHKGRWMLNPAGPGVLFGPYTGKSAARRRMRLVLVVADEASYERLLHWLASQAHELRRTQWREHIKAEQKRLKEALTEAKEAAKKAAKERAKIHHVQKDETGPFKILRVTFYNGKKGYLRADVKLRYSGRPTAGTRRARLEIEVFDRTGKQLSSEMFVIYGFAPGTIRWVGGIKLGRVPKARVRAYAIDLPGQ